MRPILINPVLCGHIKTPQSESCLTVHNLKNVEKLASHFQHYFANSCSDTLFPGAGNRPHEFLKQPPFAPKHPESQHQLPERQKRHHGDAAARAMVFGRLAGVLQPDGYSPHLCDAVLVGHRTVGVHYYLCTSDRHVTFRIDCNDRYTARWRSDDSYTKASNAIGVWHLLVVARRLRYPGKESLRGGCL